MDEPFYPAEAVVKDVELEIGGQRIDKVYSDWYRIYDELMRTGDEKEGYRRMTNFDAGAPDGQVRRFYLPLIFFFNSNPGLALPLIALQYHECKIHVTFASATEMSQLGVDTDVEPACSLWLSYTFLDAEERRRFAQTSHEYLINQLQFSGPETIAPDTASKRTSNIRLNFNHPCKYIAFAAKHPDIHGKFTTSTNLQEYNDAYAPVHEIKASFNGHDRNAVKRGNWYNQVVPFETIKSKPSAGIYLYSFCLRPQEHQPSGSANFSRIDNAQLTVSFKQGSAATVANVTAEDVTLSSVTGLSQLLIYATNYNVLRKLYYAYNSRPLAWFKDVPDEKNGGNSLGFLFKPKTLCNLLVNYLRIIGNTPGCGNLLRAISTMPFEKSRVSKQGNDLADRNNGMDWTIRSRDPTHAMKVYGSCSETAKVCA